MVALGMERSEVKILPNCGLLQSSLIEAFIVWCKTTFNALSVVGPGIGPLNCIALHESKIYIAVSNHRGQIVLFDIELGQLIKAYRTNECEAIACLSFCVSVTEHAKVMASLAEKTAGHHRKTFCSTGTLPSKA
jgi:hypothetical protein